MVAHTKQYRLLLIMNRKGMFVRVFVSLLNDKLRVQLINIAFVIKDRTGAYQIMHRKYVTALLPHCQSKYHLMITVKPLI